MPGVVMWEISPRVNGELVPSWPSSAVCPGPVAKAIRVPSPDFHFGKTGLHRHAAGRRIRLDLGGERIVAAGIEEHQLDLGVAHGLVEREIDVDGGAELDVHFRFDVGIDRQQIVGAVHRDAVSGIEEYRDIGALRLLAEFEQPLGHLVAGQVGALDDFEADIAKHARHRLGIDRWIGKLGDILVGAVADDKGDAAVRPGGVGGEHHANQGKNDGEGAHLKSPGGIEYFETATLGAKLHEKTTLRATKNTPTRKSLAAAGTSRRY